MRLRRDSSGLPVGATAVLFVVLVPLVAAPAQARPLASGPLALLQRANRIQESPRSVEEKRAGQAARVLSAEQREAARKVRLAQIALIERLMQMPLEDRQRFLRENPRIQRMPPEQRRRIHNLTQRLSRLPAEEQVLLLERYRLFLDLPPQKQQQARRIYQHWRLIEPNRRRELLREVEQLRDTMPEARRERLESAEFSQSYSGQEQRILRGLTDLFP
jgi:hypothetical protein